VTTLNIGDSGIVIINNKTKRIRVTGFWKFKPYSRCEDDLTTKLLTKLIEEDIANGVLQRSERIIPCSQEDAQLVSTNSSFFDVVNVEIDKSSPLMDVKFYEEEHKHMLDVMNKDGEMGLYGRIKLPVVEYPRLFDTNGKLHPQYSN
jgi:hypothetical protein